MMKLKTLDSPIGILGGTFDPIHLGHIEIARRIFTQCALQEIRFIPCFNPPHRSSPIASPEERLTMVQIALSYFPHFVVDDREIKRKGISYMVDTLKSLRANFPHTPFFFILGEDAFIHLFTWYQWKTVKNQVHFIVVHRGQNSENIPPEMRQWFYEKQTDSLEILYKQLAGNIYFFKTPTINISSTSVRQELKSGLKPKGLDEAVYRYILERGIYR